MIEIKNILVKGDPITDVKITNCNMCGHQNLCRPYLKFDAACDDCIMKHQEFLAALRGKKKE